MKQTNNLSVYSKLAWTVEVRITISSSMLHHIYDAFSALILDFYLICYVTLNVKFESDHNYKVSILH